MELQYLKIDNKEFLSSIFTCYPLMGNSLCLNHAAESKKIYAGEFGIGGIGFCDYIGMAKFFVGARMMLRSAKGEWQELSLADTVEVSWSPHQTIHKWDSKAAGIPGIFLEQTKFIFGDVAGCLLQIENHSAKKKEVELVIRGCSLETSLGRWGPEQDLNQVNFYWSEDNLTISEQGVSEEWTNLLWKNLLVSSRVKKTAEADSEKELLEILCSQKITPLPKTLYNKFLNSCEGDLSSLAKTKWYGLRVSLKVPPKKQKVFKMALAQGRDRQKVQESSKAVFISFQKHRRRLEKEWEDFFDGSIPAFTCSDKMAEKQYYFTWYADQANEFSLNNHPYYPYPFRVEDKPHFSNTIWQGSQCYQLAYERWRRDGFAEGAHKNLVHPSHHRDENWLRVVSESEPGRVYDRNSELPLVGLASWHLYEVTWDKNVLKETLPALIANDRHYSTLDRDGDGLVESSIWSDVGTYDDGCRFWYAGGVKEAWAPFSRRYVELVDLNTAHYLNRHYISLMASLLGDNALAYKYKLLAEQTKKCINKFMWDEEMGAYADLYGKKNAKSPCLSISCFFPLFTDIPNEKQRRRMVEVLTKKSTFWGDIPLQTISRSERLFNGQGKTPKDPEYLGWRPNIANGALSLNLSWFVAKGLVLSGYRSLAVEAFRRLVKVMTKDGFPTLFERYNSYDGEGILGQLYGWDGVIIDLLTSVVMGIEPDPVKKIIKISPCLPQDWDYARLENVKVGKGELSVECKRTKEGKYRLKVLNLEGEKIEILFPDGKIVLLNSGEKIAKEFQYFKENNRR